MVKAIDSILYYLPNNKVISLYQFGELIAFLERDKFFGFLPKLITDLARNRVNNLSNETVEGHLMLENCREIGISLRYGNSNLRFSNLYTFGHFLIIRKPGQSVLPYMVCHRYD